MRQSYVAEAGPQVPYATKMTPDPLPPSPKNCTHIPPGPSSFIASRWLLLLLLILALFYTYNWTVSHPFSEISPYDGHFPQWCPIPATACHFQLPSIRVVLGHIPYRYAAPPALQYCGLSCFSRPASTAISSSKLLLIPLQE